MKLSDLKANVYKLANVSTTAQLKAKYDAIQPLDMRYKASWETALTLARSQQDDFQSWLQNPPDEYKQLFADIDTAAADYEKSLVDAKQMSQDIAAIADQFTELAADCQDEADQLKQQVQAARHTAQQADLN